MRPVEYIFGYHYIVPVCREEYIFDIPFPASPSSLLVLYEEYIVSAFLRRPHSRSTLSVSSSPSSLHICAAGIYWSTVYNQFSLALPVTNPYDAEELEESLTGETATAEEPRPDEADELSPLPWTSSASMFLITAVARHG